MRQSQFGRLEMWATEEWAWGSGRGGRLRHINNMDGERSFSICCVPLSSSSGVLGAAAFVARMSSNLWWFPIEVRQPLYISRFGIHFYRSIALVCD
jgi:hypothetical protein